MQPTAEPTRPRIHRSTLVVATAMMLLSLILIVPGQVIFRGIGGCREYLDKHSEELTANAGDGSAAVVEHGWPHVFLRRASLSRHYSEELWDVPWLSRDAWLNWKSECFCHFSLRYLFYDVTLLLLISVAISLAWELRRRRRNHLLQMRVADILFVTTLISLCLGWHTVRRRAADAELQASDNLVRVVGTDMESPIVDLLTRLIGYRDIDFVPFRATRAYMVSTGDIQVGTPGFQMAVANFQELSSLRDLEFDGNPDEGKVFFALISQIPQLRILRLSAYYESTPLDVNTAQMLVQSQQITTIMFHERTEVTDAALKLIEEEMPNCEVRFWEEDPLEWEWLGVCTPW